MICLFIKKNVTQNTTTRRRSKRKRKEDFETGTYLKEVTQSCIFILSFGVQFFSDSFSLFKSTL